MASGANISTFFKPIAAGAIIAGETSKMAVSAAKAIKSQLGRSSLSRMAQDSIFQFPFVVSASIETDDIAAMARAFDKNYAAMMVSVISLHSEMNRAKYDSVADFLKTFHTSSLTDELITSKNMLLEATGTLESITLSADDVMGLWAIAEEQVDTESLNNIYQPYVKTKRILSECLTKMTATTEATTPSSSRTDDSDGTLTFGDTAYKLQHDGRFSGELDKAKKDFYDKHPRLDRAKNGINDTLGQGINKSTDKEVANALSNQKNKFDKGAYAIVDDKSIASLAPTLINVTINSYDTTDGSSVTWSKNVVIGVKSMVRMVRSNMIVANMVEACHGFFPFQFIKWAKGEYKTADMIFGISDAKELANASATNRWLKSLKAKAKSNKFTRFIPGMKTMMPNATIVITETEAMMIKDACGIDLHEIGKAKELLKKYFLLAFGIYDTETKMLQLVYDSDAPEYTSTSLRQLSALVHKDTNILV